jgi:hypothetical protein
MKFKQLGTGVILETNNEFVIGQLKKSTDYEEVKQFTKKEEPVEEKVEKTDKKKND